MKKIWVFRHGETDWNVQERFQGHLDIPLNERGREQARSLIKVLENAGLEMILSSDLTRASETARIIADGLGLRVVEDARLREAHLGKAQGLTRAEIEAQFGEDLARRWRSSHVTDADISYPGGETGNQIIQRVTRSLEDFLEKHPALRTIGVATHGGVIRRLMQILRPPGSKPVPIPNIVTYAIHYDPVARRFGLDRNSETV